MKMENLALCLQLFAEAADGGTAQFTGGNEAAAAPQATGDTQASDAGVQEDRSSAFEKLIKGEFKQEYDARIRDTLQKRLKDHKDLSQKLEALTPAVRAMAQRYGVDPEDIPALTRAVETDRATAIRQPQLQAQHQTQVWKNQALQTYQTYPDFDLGREMADPRFTRLLRADVDVKSAYELLHRQEHIAQAMAYAAGQTERRLADKLTAAKNRPGENGMTGASAAAAKQDVSQMSRRTRAEIIRRVQQGETIRF